METNVRIKDLMKAYIPETISFYPIASFMWSHGLINDKKMTEYIMEYNRYKIQVLRRIHSNNWLRLHGYPMKKKSSKWMDRD